MTRTQMLARLKELLDESVIDPGWVESTLMSYLAEGQAKFCEDTGFFIDKTNFTIDTEIGTSVYALDERIIKVLGVYDGTTRLGKYGERDTEPAPGMGNLTFDFSSPTGDAQAWNPEEVPGSLVLYPTPTTVRTLTLRVWRYPLYALDDDDIDGEGTPASPEIPSRFHRACIEWAAYVALTHHDKELEDPIDAGKHLTAYNRYVTEGKIAFNRLRGTSVNVSPSSVYITE